MTATASVKANGLDAVTIQHFQASLRGAVLRPGDDGYDPAFWRLNQKIKPTV